MMCHKLRDLDANYGVTEKRMGKVRLKEIPHSIGLFKTSNFLYKLKFAFAYNYTRSCNNIILFSFVYGNTLSLYT